MLKSFTIPTCLALGLTLTATQTNAQVVREGVRRTGEAVTQGGRAVAQGTRNAINRTGQAPRNVINNTPQATRAGEYGAPSGQVQPSVSANANSDVNAGAPSDSAQLQSGINANQQFDDSMQAPLPADPNGAPMQGRYQAGYRGSDNPAMASGQATYQGRAYRLRHDRQGREFICVGGHPVYFGDQQSSQPQEREAYKLNGDRMTKQDQLNNQSRSGQADDQTRQYQGSYAPQATPPAPPAPIRSDLNSSAPASPSLNSDTNISADQRTQLNESADVDAAANAYNSVESSAHDTASGASGASSSTKADHSGSTSDSSVNAATSAESEREDAND